MIAAAADGRPERVDPDAAAGALPADVRRVRQGALRPRVTFVSKAALKNPAVRKLDLAKPLVAVKNTRTIGKRDMKNNDAMPRIDVDPETYEVRVDGVLWPASRRACCRWRSGTSCSVFSIDLGANWFRSCILVLAERTEDARRTAKD